MSSLRGLNPPPNDYNSQMILPHCTHIFRHLALYFTEAETGKPSINFYTLFNAIQSY